MCSTGPKISCLTSATLGTSNACGEISRVDGEGNTYQVRTLGNGMQHEILKNFQAENEVRDMLHDFAVEIRWTELPYYWYLTCRLK